MMRDYKRYDEYKDSGIDYLKTIPKNWSEMKIKYIAKNNLESFIDGDWIESPYIQDEGIRLIQTGNIGNGKYIEKGDRYISEETFMKLGCTEIFPDDILICRLAEPVGRACLAPKLNNRMITSVDVCRLTPKDKYLKKFIVYYMQMYKYLDYIDSLARGSTRQRISRSQLGEVYITTPSKPEQQIIASFLDKKTAELDEIITKKESLIDQLEKYKKTVITESVTKGKLGNKYINEDGDLVDEIEMKDSGFEWIGEIPDYWEVNRVKFNNLINPNKSEINYKDMEVSFVPMEYIKDGVIEDQDTKNIDEVYDGYSYFTEQDILLAKVTPCFENNNIGIASDLKNGIGFGTTEVHVIRALDDFNRYIFYLFQSKHFKNKGKSVMYGAGGLKRVPTDFVENYFYGRPKYEIQKLISNYLDRKINQIYNLIQKTKESIEKYKEYKKSLIFEAVTGKIDLRDYKLEGGEELAEHNNSSEIERERLSAVD